MSGPWDQYAAQDSGPWAQYAAPAADKPKTREWKDVPAEALANAASSAGNFVDGIWQAVKHPIDTAGNLADLVDGGLRKLSPDGGAAYDARQNASLPDYQKQTPEQLKASREGNIAKADATGQFFKDRYGSAEGLKTTLATDPIGALSDASAVLTGGGALASKLPMLGRAGAVVKVAGDAVNPLSVVRTAAVKGLPKLGEATAQIVGGLGTHTGAETIKTAFKAGQKGGKSAETLADNMRGNVPMADVLTTAKANLADMGRAKSQAYQQGMAQVSGDQSILNFNGIDQAVQDAAKIGTYKGAIVNDKAAGVQQAIAQAVEEWKGMDPAHFHTPEGLDALKQRIGGIVDSVPFEEKTARLAGDKIYHAVKDEIVKQAPVYADTMKAYSEATEQIREVERALSLGKKASVDTAMRKLQSLTRNNVNTNYGNRLDLARTLEQQGGRDLMTALSGQALSSWTPRSLGGATAGLSGFAGYSVGGLPGAAATMAVQSPRLMGEAALATGKAATKIKKLSELPRKAMGGQDPAAIANWLYQSGRLPQ